ncbi:uncharacterized protein ACDP82_014734 isoform 2-T2 [Pangshura tecta]
MAVFLAPLHGADRSQGPDPRPGSAGRAGWQLLGHCHTEPGSVLGCGEPGTQTEGWQAGQGGSPEMGSSPSPGRWGRRWGWGLPPAVVSLGAVRMGSGHCLQLHHSLCPHVWGELPLRAAPCTFLPLPLLSRQPESEQDASEDGGSSLGSSSVALDPVEKEWLQGAASGHLLTLSHLLKQEPSLATRKASVALTALHWAAKHGQEDLASLLVAAGADVNSRSVTGSNGFSSPPPHAAPRARTQHVSTCLSLCPAAVRVGGAEGTGGCRGLARIPGGGGCAGRGPELRWDGACLGRGGSQGPAGACTALAAWHWMCGA